MKLFLLSACVRYHLGAEFTKCMSLSFNTVSFQEKAVNMTTVLIPKFRIGLKTSISSMTNIFQSTNSSVVGSPRALGNTHTHTHERDAQSRPQ